MSWDSVIRDRLAMHRIAERLGATVNEIPRLSNIFDIMMTHFCHGVTVELYAPRDEADLHTVASIRVLRNGRNVTRQLSFCKDIRSDVAYPADLQLQIL